MKKILVIGEVLFDVINGTEYIGGAPFNYAFHLHRFKQIFHLDFQIEFATKICNDIRGKKVLQFFKENELSTHLLQANDVYETGVVYASIDTLNNAQYYIEEHCAYDYIDYSPELKAFIKSGIQFLYYGTLFLRSGHNRKTLAQCLPDDAIFNQKILIDINIRQNYYNWEIIDDCLLNASYLKLNEEELQLLNRNYFVDKGMLYDRDVVDFLLNEYVLDGIILTKGNKGAGVYLDESNFWEIESPVCYNIIDTIGAGDAFSAVFTLGQLLDWHPKETLTRATQFATEICRVKGAIPAEKDWYTRFSHWFNTKK